MVQFSLKSKKSSRSFKTDSIPLRFVFLYMESSFLERSRASNADKLLVFSDKKRCEFLVLNFTYLGYQVNEKVYSKVE